MDYLAQARRLVANLTPEERLELAEEMLTKSQLEELAEIHFNIDRDPNKSG